MNATDWSAHHELTKNNLPSELLVKALANVPRRDRVLDIGDGALKDARYLLGEGFDVTVVDQNILPLTSTFKKLHCHAVAFDEFVFEKDAFDLATAMFALPFNPPESFDTVFTAIKDSLKSGGIFCGQFFGKRDGWSDRLEMTFHTKEQVEQLFADMEIISLVEVEKDSKTADGNPKHWHVFHVIAKKH